MHLKICPNPQCGKISDVGVAACEFCGQVFPKIALASEAAAAAPAASPAPGNVPGDVKGSATRDKPRTAAWPLIVVAIVAGGLPLLWANRASLPTPKPWQVSTPDATKVEGAAAPPVATIKPPVVPELTPAPIPAPAHSAVPSSPAPVPAPASGVDQGKPTPPGTADVTTKNPEAPLQAGDTPKETAKEAVKKTAKAPSPKKKEPPRPCTEAMAALGLCDPKRPGQ